MPSGNVLKLENLLEIADVLEKYNDADITVVMRVNSQETINRINDDYYYRENKEGTPEYADKIEVELNGIRFIYAVKDEPLNL